MAVRLLNVNSSMTRCRSLGDMALQRVISAKVRQHPSQKPLAGSITQILMQGLIKAPTSSLEPNQHARPATFCPVDPRDPAASSI
jgi:hypothetical protein